MRETSSEISAWRVHDVTDVSAVEYAPEIEEAHLLDYWKMLKGRLRLVALVWAVIFGLGVGLTLFQTPRYTATVTLSIEPQDPAVMQLQELLATQVTGSGAYDYYQTQFALLEARTLAARVIQELALELNPVLSERSLLRRLYDSTVGVVPAFFTYVSKMLGVAHPQSGEGPQFEFGVHPKIIERYLSLLEVNPVKNTRLVQVTFSTPVASLSRELANAHATAFIRMNLKTRFELTQEARAFLEERLSDLKGKVESSEKALNEFRQARGVVSVQGNENIVVDRMIDLNKRLTDARAKRIEAESLYRTLENKNSQRLSKIIDNEAVQRLKASLNVLEARQTQLSTVFKPDHPRILELKQQINEAEQRLDREIGNIVHATESDYVAARAREEALEAEAAQQQRLALELKELGVQYWILQSDADSNRTLYDSVLKRLKETNVSGDVPVSNIQIRERAELPLVPSSPRVLRNLSLSAALGLFLGAGLVFFLRYLDSSVKTAREVWQAVAVPTLGVVPHLSSLQPRAYGLKHARTPAITHSGQADAAPVSRELALVHHPFSMISECYRAIRAALMLSQAGKPPQVVLLTSALPGEGKTVTTLNLGIALAQSGRKVLVIDADLRRGRCHELLNVRNHRGLTNVLTGSLAVEESIQPTPVDGLSLLSVGSRPPNPAELLGSSNMRELLVQLRQHFDFILIDSPPVIAVSDAMELSVMCDGVLMVIRAQQTSIETARRSMHRLKAVQARVLGAVLNGVDMHSPDYADYGSYFKDGYGAAEAESGTNA